MSAALDPRRNAFREDLAAAALQGRVRAPRFAEGTPRQITAPVVPVRAAPRYDAPLLTEALAGETLSVYDAAGGWLWAQLDGDGYVGYVPAEATSTTAEPPTHRITALATFVYPSPDLKHPPFMRLPFGAAVGAGEPTGRFAPLARGGFVFAGHLRPSAETSADFVRVAERFVGVPYLWGGKSAYGLDCSALVQLSLAAAGVPAPRDSDMQEAEIGVPIAADTAAAQRGDLMFWKGHVAIVQAAGWLLHASGHHMEVVLEPLGKALARIAQTHGPVRTMRRMMGRTGAA